MAVALAVAVTMLGVAVPADASWSSAGSGTGAANSGTLAPPTQVTATQSGPDVTTVTWEASAGTLAPQGYYIERTGLDGTHPACGTSAAVLRSTTACLDGGLTSGTFTYRVIAVYLTWTAPSAVSAPVTVSAPLAAASPFSVLGTAVTSTGSTRISGDVGTTPGTAVVGFPAGIVDGDIHAGDQAAATAQVALTSAIAYLRGRTASAQISGDIGGTTRVPGIYHAGAALGLTGTLTLDGGGNPDAVFIFQVEAAMNTAAASSVLLINGAEASNVYWVVNAAVGTGASSQFKGNILAQGAITLGAGAELIGRALSQDAVTLGDATVRFTQQPAPTIAIQSGPSAITKDTTPTIAGTTTAPAGRTVTVTVGGQTLTASVQPDQTWSVTAAELSAGTYPIVAKVKDAAGNGATATAELTVETNPPTVNLGGAAAFSILAGTTVAATGSSDIAGDVGVSPGTSITGLPPSSVRGTIHAGDVTAADALADLTTAINDASGRLPHTQFSGDLGGTTFHAGVHHTGAALALTGEMVLDGENNPNAVFIFQVDAAMNTAASSRVQLINGASASRVFWVVDAAVGTGASTTLPGTILATGAITLGAETQLNGRALTLDGVVMASSTITAPSG